MTRCKSGLIILVGALALAVLGTSLAVAANKPGPDAKPLSEIIKSLEKQGYSPITEVEWEHDVWEVEAYKDGQERKLRVDPATGKILSDRPDD